MDLVTIPVYGLHHIFLIETKEYIANNVLSQLKAVKYGVPQGSILGPILFTLYINSLPNCTRNCQTFLYADDSVISSTSLQTLTDSVKSVEAWCAENLLTI